MSAPVPKFFRLPKALLINFLSEWLDIQDVGKLDAAMTTRVLRPTFLQYLQDMRSTTVDGPKVWQKVQGTPSVTVKGHTIRENGTGLNSFKFLIQSSHLRGRDKLVATTIRNYYGEYHTTFSAKVIRVWSSRRIRCQPTCEN